MEFGGDEDDDEEGDSGRSGSVELDMDMDEMDGETKDAWRKLALGTGSGGVKGRRKGMVFKCEHCNKVICALYMRGENAHFILGVPPPQLSRQASLGT